MNTSAYHHSSQNQREASDQGRKEAQVARQMTIAVVLSGLVSVATLLVALFMR